MGRQRNTRQPNGQDFEAVSQGYGIWTDFPSVTEETAHVFARLEDIQISHQQLLDAVCRRTFFEFEPIYYGHHYRFDFNAVAFRHDRGCFIGLNVGTYGVLNSVFQRLLSTPYYFPNIGDVSREDVSIPRSNILGLSLSNGNIQQNLGHHPKCPIRKGCVELFASIAFDFILMHELGHLSRGHLGLMGQLTGSEVYTEFTRNDGRITCDTSQALELDADGFAISSVFYSVVLMSERHSEAPIAWQAVLKEPTVALLVAAVSIYTVFRLFSHRQQLDLDNFAVGTHPHPMLRMFRCPIYLKPVIEHFKPRFDEHPTLHHQIPVAANKIFEEALECITLGEPEFAYRELLDMRIVGRVDHLDEVFEKLRPILDEHRWL